MASQIAERAVGDFRKHLYGAYPIDQFTQFYDPSQIEKTAHEEKQKVLASVSVELKQMRRLDLMPLIESRIEKETKKLAKKSNVNKQKSTSFMLTVIEFLFYKHKPNLMSKVYSEPWLPRQTFEEFYQGQVESATKEFDQHWEGNANEEFLNKHKMKQVEDLNKVHDELVEDVEKWVSEHSTQNCQESRFNASASGKIGGDVPELKKEN